MTFRCIVSTSLHDGSKMDNIEVAAAELLKAWYSLPSHKMPMELLGPIQKLQRAREAFHQMPPAPKPETMAITFKGQSLANVSANTQHEHLLTAASANVWRLSNATVQIGDMGQQGSMILDFELL